jgi:hypothetical protein
VLVYQFHCDIELVGPEEPGSFNEGPHGFAIGRPNIVAKTARTGR